MSTMLTVLTISVKYLTDRALSIDNLFLSPAISGPDCPTTLSCRLGKRLFFVCLYDYFLSFIWYNSLFYTLSVDYWNVLICTALNGSSHLRGSGTLAYRQPRAPGAQPNTTPTRRVERRAELGLVQVHRKLHGTFILEILVQDFRYFSPFLGAKPSLFYRTRCDERCDQHKNRLDGTVGLWFKVRKPPVQKFNGKMCHSTWLPSWVFLNIRNCH